MNRINKIKKINKEKEKRKKESRATPGLVGPKFLLFCLLISTKVGQSGFSKKKRFSPWMEGPVGNLRCVKTRCIGSRFDV
jgi:hypothetical protein